MSVTDHIAGLLARAPLFGTFPHEALIASAERFREVRFRKDEMLFARGPRRFRKRLEARLVRAVDRRRG